MTQKLTRREALKAFLRGAVIGSLYAISDTPLLATSRKPKQTLENKTKETSQKPKTTPKKETPKQTIPIFESNYNGKITKYDNPELQKQDDLIIQYCNFWNKDFSDKGNFKPIKSDLAKKIMLVETAWEGTPVKEFNKDCMQIGRDYGWKLAKEGGEIFYPEEGYPDTKIKELDSEMSIKYGVRMLIQKAITSHKFVSEKQSDKTKKYKLQSGDSPAKIAKKFNTTTQSILKKNNIKDPTKLQIGQELIIPDHELVPKIMSMDYTDVASRYNGGGDQHYQEKFDSFSPVKD